MQSNDNRIKVLAEAPVLKAIFTMAIPVMLGMIVEILYNLVDTFFIGKLNDVNQLAASNVGFPFFMIVMAIGGVIGVGASSVISRYLGMKKTKEAGEIVGLSIYLAAAIGAVVMVLTLIFLDPICALLGAHDAVALPTKQYLLPLVLGSVLLVTNFALGMMVRAEGAATQSMTGMMIGSVTNIILNPTLIFGLGLGITGSALATVLANTAALLWYVRFYAKKSLLKVSFGKRVWTSEYIRQIFSIGIPAGLNQGLMSVSNIITNNLVAAYGATSLASMGVALKVNSMVILLLVGLAVGCQPLFGFNYGARNKARLRSILKTSMLAAFILGTTMLIIFTLTGKHIIAIFSSIPEVVAQGSYVLTAVSSAAPVIGIIMITMNCLQAFGKSVPSLILSTGRQGLYYIPLLFTLNALFGFHGLVFTQPIVDVLMLITATAMLRYVFRKDPVLNGKETAGEAVAWPAEAQV
jgi:putative MATE family efflux protein